MKILWWGSARDVRVVKWWMLRDDEQLCSLPRTDAQVLIPDAFYCCTETHQNAGFIKNWRQFILDRRKRDTGERWELFKKAVKNCTFSGDVSNQSRDVGFFGNSIFSGRIIWAYLNVFRFQARSKNSPALNLHQFSTSMKFSYYLSLIKVHFTQFYTAARGASLLIS